jgi:hypothetical protein
MKKALLFSFMLTAAIVPQLVLAGGGPAVKMQPLTAEQITSANSESSIQGQDAEDAMEVHVDGQTQSSKFRFFPTVSENTTISAGINAIALFGSIALVAGVAFFIYKYYRKTQEINRMLGIDTGKSDLDETKKTE